MKDLKNAFNTMVSNYPQRLELINNPQNIMGFTSYDIFSLRPFHVEINRLPQSLLKIYKTQEELPENSRIIACIIQQGSLVQVREFINQGVYRDSLFITDENFKWRYTVDVNNEKVSAVNVERLTYDSKGLFDTFESYEKNYFLKDCYTAKDKYLQMNSEIKRDKNQIYNYQYNIYRKEQLVNKIEQIEGDFVSVIYDTKLKEQPLDKLLAMAKKYIIQSIVDNLANNNNISDEIMMMLLEYNLQTPFPPTMALGKTAEFDDCSANGELLSFYNAPDLEYFSEEDSLVINFIGESIYSELNNRLLAELEDDNLEETVFSFYLNLIKSLKRNRKIKQILSLHKNYHVVARDFEQSNEIDFLRSVLTKPAFAKLDKEIESYNEDHRLTDQDRAYFKEIAIMLDEKTCDYQELTKGIESANTELSYSVEEAHFLQPYYLELQHGEYLEIENIHPKILSAKPDVDQYYEIHSVKGQVFVVYFVSHGKKENAKYYVYSEEHTDEYYFSLAQKNVELISFSSLKFTNNKPKSYQIFSKIRIHKSYFKLDKQNRIEKSKETATLYSEDSQLTDNSYHLYHYDDNGICSIEHVYKDLPTVVFSNDIQFLNQHKEFFSQQVIKMIFNYLDSVNYNDYSNINIESSAENPLIPMKILLRKKSGDEVVDSCEIEFIAENKVIDRFIAITQFSNFDHFSYYPFKRKIESFIEDQIQSLKAQISDKLNKNSVHLLTIEWK